jgi:hypothetical protein
MFADSAHYDLSMTGGRKCAGAAARSLTDKEIEWAAGEYAAGEANEE